MHGYTYSGHPLACAAALGTMDAYNEDKIFENSVKMAPVLEAAIHTLRGKPHVVDIRNCGLLAGVQLAEHSKEDPARYAREVSYELFRRGAMVRYTGMNLYLSPPLIVNAAQIEQLVTMIGDVLDTY